MNFDVVFKEKDIELQADFGSKIELKHLIVQSMTEEKVYAISNSSVDAPTEWEDEAPIPTTDKPYLWMKTKTSCTTVDGTVYNFADNGIVVGTIGKDGSPGKDGKTPVKGVDYWTEEEQANIVAKVTQDVVTEEMIQQVISTLATPVFGRVDENNNIILSGELVNGTYTLKYENADGNLVIIGKITQNGSTGDEIIIPTWTYGEKIENDGTITTTGVDQYCYSDFIEFEQNTRIHLYCSNKNGLHCKLFYYAENEDTGEKTFLSAVDWVINDSLDGEKEITIDETSYTGATCVRLRCNVLTAGEWEKLDRLTVTRVKV